MEQGHRPCSLTSSVTRKKSLTVKYFIYLCSPIKRGSSFWCNGVFSIKTDRFKATEPEKPEQPSGCEDFEDEGQRRKLGIS